MGLCYGCCGLVPATTLIARWFEARRALALSIASTGLSLGGVIITPLAVALIASQGLANSGIWFGMIFLVGIVPVSALILRSPPAHHLDRQHHADQRGARLSDGGSTSWRDAFRTRFFVGLTVAYIFALGAQVGTITHLYLLVSSRGLVDIASIVIATTAIASIFGRLSGAWLLLRFSNRDFTLAMLGLQAVGVVLLATAYSIPSLIFGALVFGATVGNILMLQSLLLAEAFGVREYGRIYSLSQFIGVWGVAGSPMLVGQIYEKTSNYELAYLVIAAGALIGTLSMALAGPVRRREHESA